MSVPDCMTHTWQNGLPSSEMLQRGDYNAQQDVASGHPGFTDVVNSIPSISPDEIVGDDEDSGINPVEGLSRRSSH